VNHLPALIFDFRRYTKSPQHSSRDLSDRFTHQKHVFLQPWRRRWRGKQQWQCSKLRCQSGTNGRNQVIQR
jgi:hypothetical protein